MRLLIVTSAFPNGPGDPRGTFIRVLAGALAREGVDVTVLAPGTPSSTTEDYANGIALRRATYWIPRWQGLAVGLGGIVPNIRSKPYLALQVPPLVASLARSAVSLSKRADIVHAHWVYPAGIAALAAARCRGLPVLVTSHGGDLNLARQSRILRWATRRISHAADVCIGVSHAMVGQFRELGIAESRARFIPLGVERGVPITASDPGFGLYQSFRGFRGFRIVYAGSLIPRKSVESLIEAHRQLETRGHRVATLLVGAGPTETRLRQLIAQGDCGNVFFTGRQPPRFVRTWIGAGDVLVLPSRSEGRGLVIVEAMAEGLPVVASDIPGPQELVRDGENGRLFPVGDADKLADCLELLLRNRKLRFRMGERSRSIIEEEGLTPQHCAKAHVELYREILAKRRQSLAAAGVSPREAAEVADNGSKLA